jgi:N-acetylneuraminate synthase/N,N'-diacetyllegionaminate synthase
MEDVNLLAMNIIRQELGVNVGYSDHTKGIEVPIAAVALGACIIEKHFTLDRNMEGPDHKASINPKELRSLVDAIRNIELALSGNGLKKPSQSEIKNKLIARKSIHLKNSVLSGHILKREDLEMKRPGDGLSPMLLDKLIGKKIIFDLQAEHKLSLEDLE